MDPSAEIAIQTLDTTLEVLKDQRHSNACAYLAYLVNANTVLTLSGARAFCHGFYTSEREQSTYRWEKEITTALNALCGVIQADWRKTEVGKALAPRYYASYELLLLSGLTYVSEHSELFGYEQLAFSSPVDRDDVEESVADVLGQQKALRHFDNGYLGHAAFGLLNGYPDKAIISSLEVWSRPRPDPFAEPLIDADIRGAAYYATPEPVYSYSRSLIDDPVIRKHEQLWSHILESYYTSPFHRHLEQQREFQDKLSELGMAV
jgi:hypothetical protein